MKQTEGLKKKIKEHTKSGSLLLMGRLEMCRYDELGWTDTNRDWIEAHSDNLGKSVQKNGLIRPFIVFPKDKQGKHKLADAHHLMRGMESNIRPDEMVPIFNLWWVDPNNEEETQYYIILTNQGVISWKTYAFVKSYSKTKGGAYSTLLGQINAYKKMGISIGVTVAAYLKQRRIDLDHPLKLGTMKFKSKEEMISTSIMNYVSQLKGYTGDKLDGENSWLGNFVTELWKTAEYMKCDFNKFNEFLKKLQPGFEQWIKTDVLDAKDSLVHDKYNTIVRTHYKDYLK